MHEHRLVVCCSVCVGVCDDFVMMVSARNGVTMPVLELTECIYLFISSMDLFKKVLHVGIVCVVQEEVGLMLFKSSVKKNKILF